MSVIYLLRTDFKLRKENFLKSIHSLRKLMFVKESRLILKAVGVCAGVCAAFMKMLSVYNFIRFGSVY